MLDQMIVVVAASTLVAYIIRCLGSETIERFSLHRLVPTIPFPVYGIPRDLYIVHRRERGGKLPEMLLDDRPLPACVALWSLTVGAVISRPSGS